MLTPQLQATATAPRERTVVAVVLHWRGRIGLFHRGSGVAHDVGLWHCITGYVSPCRSPEQQALEELHEETGLVVAELVGFSRGELLHLLDDQGQRWAVHTFRADTHRRRLELNDEHDGYRWVLPTKIQGFENRVRWLDEVLRAAERRG